MIGGVVLAAGGSRRFGSPKQLAPLAGRPLLEHALVTIQAIPEIERIVVVLGANADEIAAVVDLGGCEMVVASDWDEGIAASVRTGIAALAADANVEAAVLVLGDQPLLTPHAIEAVLEGIGGRAPALRATYSGVPGHPVVVKRELFAEIAGLRGDLGASGLLELAGAARCEVGHLADPADVDTEADLARLGATK